jgi:DNA primase
MRVTVASLRDAPLRAILQAFYDLHAVGASPTFEQVYGRIDDPAVRDLATTLLGPLERAPLKSGFDFAPLEVRLTMALFALADRERQERIRELRAALNELDQSLYPDEYNAIHREILKYYHQRPDNKRSPAS